jgi:hypothetical protein
MANNGIYYSSGNSLNFTTNSTTWATLGSGGTFVIDTVSGGTYLNLPSSTFTGGTVTGSTDFTNGLTANTISATTYYNLPVSGITAGTGIGVSDSNGNYTISYTGSTGTSGDYLPLSGGTVTGGTIFTSGVTADTLSNVNYILFDTTATTTHTEGQIHWNDDTKTLEIDTDKTGVTYETGQNTLVRVTNKTGAPLTAGTVVYINGAQAGRPTVTKATYEQDATSARSLGFITQTINDNNQGYVTTNGLLRNVNTNSYTAGTQLYLYTGGTITNVRPVAPLHEVRLGYVVTQDSTAGVIYVYIQNGYEFTELHDVQISGQTNNDIPYWNSALGVWKNTNSPVFTSLTATTISATTYQNLPVSAVTSGTGISASTSNGVVTVSNTQVQGITGKTDGTGISSSISNNVITITNTDLGSSQNIFKNIQIAGVTQFSAGSNSSNLNFSGVNITITSAATNTLVFSGNSGTVTSVTLLAGTSGTDVNISNSAVTTSGTITINIPDASATARGLITTGTQTIVGNKTINGNLTITGNTIISGLTASQIVATDSTDTLVSLDTATYPSLIELTYVKGVTSGIQTQLDSKEPTITNGYGISGTTTKQVSLTSTQVFATATTSINAATYLDIAGCSVSLAPGTWLVTGHVVIAAANLIIQGFVAITDGSNNVVAASALSRGNSGTASLNSPIAISWSALVSPGTTTTYKLRAARGLTTHTSTYTVYNGTGYNTANHATDNSNLGTNILAIRIS